MTRGGISPPGGIPSRALTAGLAWLS